MLPPSESSEDKEFKNTKVELLLIEDNDRIKED